MTSHTIGRLLSETLGTILLLAIVPWKRWSEFLFMILLWLYLALFNNEHSSDCWTTYN